MSDFSVFQFLSLGNKTRNLDKLVKRWGQGSVHVVLDLEDSVVGAKDGLPGAKDHARALCAKFLRDRDAALPAPNFLVRINAVKSSDFAGDIQAVKEALEVNPQPLTLVLPKVEEVADLHTLGDAIADWPARITVVPILETIAGIEAAEKVLPEVPGGLGYVFVGLFDYQYERGHFPYWADDAPEVLDFAEGMARRIEDLGGQYIHGPMLNLNGPKVAAALGKLTQRLGRCPHFSSTSPFQTNAYFGRDAALRFKAPLPTEPANLARMIVSSYESADRGNRSYVITGSRFIPPQEYKLAKDFLESGHGTDGVDIP